MGMAYHIFISPSETWNNKSPIIIIAILRIPVFTHDSDVEPGLATKINSLWADKILVSSDKSLPYFVDSKQYKIFVTGNPVRAEISSGSREEGKKIIGINDKRSVILVMGGSLGADQLNNLILDNLEELTEKYFIIHQTPGTLIIL